MKRIGLGVALTVFGLIVGFQNCANKSNFGQAAVASSSPSEPSQTSAPTPTPTPVSVPAPAPASAPTPAPNPIRCTTYFVPGDLSTIHNSVDLAGRVELSEVFPGTQIYQAIGCNGRPASYGYQASYCNAPTSGCDQCLGGPANYTCDATGNWSEH